MKLKNKNIFFYKSISLENQKVHENKYYFKEFRKFETQKYFEPMMIFIFFLLLSSKLPEEFLKNYKNLLYLYIYVFFYFILAIINDVLQITRNF